MKDPDSIYPPVTDITEELKKLTEISGKKILEVGAGTGRDGIKMKDSGGDIFFLDYSIKSLRLIKYYLKNDVANLILADAQTCPFKNNTFDVVFHQGLLEHFARPHRILKENQRVLKKSGLLIVDVPQTFHVYTIMKKILMIFGLWFAGWERQFTSTSLARLLKQYGFEPIYYYGDWSRPGIIYKILREILAYFKIKLPMFPRYFGRLTNAFYNLQHKMRQKRIFLYTVLSIGIVARKI